MKRVKDAFDERAAALDGLLGVGRSFDMIGRTLRIGGRRARLWVVNGYGGGKSVSCRGEPSAERCGISHLHCAVQQK